MFYVDFMYVSRYIYLCVDGSIVFLRAGLALVQVKEGGMYVCAGMNGCMDQLLVLLLLILSATITTTTASTFCILALSWSILVIIAGPIRFLVAVS